MKVDTSISMVGIKTFHTISIVAKHSIDLTKTRQSQVHLEKNVNNSLLFILETNLIDLRELIYSIKNIETKYLSQNLW